MRKGAFVLLAGSAALLVALTAPAQAADPSAATIRPGKQLKWEGEFYAAGANVSNTNPLGGQVCADDPGGVPVVNACDVLKLKVDVPHRYWNKDRKGGVRVEIEWDSPDNDFDMYAFRRAPEGGVSPAHVITSSAEGGTRKESIRLFNAKGTYLIRINPFAVVASGYTGKVSFFKRPSIRDAGGGVRQFRASRSGFLSYSEPHIAMDPVRPKRLVAGSKMYQDLGTYRFKIGTFFSRDGGRTWRDNGILPGYPKQSGDEGAGYYTTSDVWTAFDDEGNAYAMVLDHPPGSLTGAGWGMTLHKSTNGGRTWSGRIPIHENQDPISELLFLDDKNTLVVDNFGPDRDGKTGNIYGCWSFDTIVELLGTSVGANLAVFVARSTNAGEAWEASQNVSGLDRSVVGCHVVIGPPETPGGPGIVYVFWLNFNDAGSDTGASIRMAKSTDGGETYSAPQTVVEINDVPRELHPTEIRTLSLPWAAVDPRNGRVYLTWADYRRSIRDEFCPPDEEAPKDQVCDADILLTWSSNGGRTWKKRIRVNQDRRANGKDQFQQALAVTPRGQLNMMWYDRRRDRRNFNLDTFFARSNDRGKSWKETRVTRSMFDPEVNPPISPSGHFFGDYQGIVANDRVAIPFWQDTTLANRRGRRHNPFQQVFSARIPNTKRFGGK